MKTTLIAPILLLLAVGCGEPEEETAATEAEPKPVAFDGKPDDRFVGKWKLKGKNSTYDLRKDGSYSFAGKVSTPGGVLDNKFESEWRASGEMLLLKDASGNVTPYRYKLAGSTLTLQTTGSLKHETVLVKG